MAAKNGDPGADPDLHVTNLDQVFIIAQDVHSVVIEEVLKLEGDVNEANLSKRLPLAGSNCI